MIMHYASSSTPGSVRSRSTLQMEIMRQLQALGHEFELVLPAARILLEKLPQRRHELSALIEQRDRAGLKAAIHSLKGALGNFIGGLLFEQCGQLETGVATAPWEALTLQYTVLDTGLLEFEDALQGLVEQQISSAKLPLF